MKRLLLCVSVLLCGLARAQTPTDVNLNFLAQGNGAFGGPLGYYDNRAVQAVTWTVAYESDGGITGYTIAFQYAQGATAPGSFSTLTPVASSTSFGTAQYGIATYNVLSSTPGSSIASDFLQVAVSGGGGTGAIRIQIYGYKTGPTGGTGGGGGGGGGSGCPNPCPVEGVDAAGAAPTVPPVATAGFDGTDNRRIITDSSGRQVVVGGAASGSVPAGNPVPTAGFDGTDVRSLRTDTAGELIIAAQTQFVATQLAVTASATSLASTNSKSVCVHALIGNTINVYAGPSAVTTATGMEIPPGQGYCWNVSNPALIFVIASTTGASVSYTYTN